MLSQKTTYMKQIKFLLIAAGLIAFASCNNSGDKDFKVPESKAGTITGNVDSNQYDPNRGAGKYSFDNLQIPQFLDEKMAANGEKIAKEKCYSCHKPSIDTLKGPGWSGVTQRRTAHWLMNYMLDPDAMLDVDPKLKAAVDSCKMRMPNLKLTDLEARDILEFMRKNDGVKPKS